MCSVADPLNDADNIVISKSELAVLAMDDGRWAEADKDLEYALSLVEDLRLHDYAISVIAFAAVDARERTMAPAAAETGMK